jgi:amino acid adenylation domain-containing protein
VALTYGKQCLSYRELDDRANRLAHYLLRMGIGVESLVGVCIERSIELVVAILGILKAGAAYAPLDPTQPTERLAYMIQDSKLAVLLTQQTLLTKLPVTTLKPLCLDSDWGAISANDHNKPLTAVVPDNLAYVIYTSGSTGSPKGVMITHRGFANYLNWSAHEYSILAGTGAPVNTSIGFDATATSLFLPLIAGKKVVLLPENQEIVALVDALLSGEDFILVKFTPPHLELLKINLKGELARKVRARAFIIGGEALTTSAIEYWQTHAPSIRLINEYGPTETVVGCSFYDATAQRLQSGLVPIGRPISNTELYVLDRHLEPVPIGVTGELHIGGVGVGRGYFGRPELTSGKFIPHPFKNDPQARLYRTGDLARYLPDGTIQFVGRDDDQVKIRGFRVELAEIEAALLQHSDVHTAAVNVWHDKKENKHLVAYVIRSETAEGDGTRELRDFLKLKLPQYMIPSAFVWLQELPLTSNGKVDKHRLPPPDTYAPVLLPQPVAMTGMEDLIAVIWKEVLGVSEIRVDDNFFDIGGHSLLLAQVQQELSQRLDRQIPMIELLQFPTIDSLAAHLTGRVEASEFQHIHNRSQDQKKAISLYNQERKAASARRIRQKT